MKTRQLLRRWTGAWRGQLLAFAGLLACVPVVENWRGQRAWEAALARLRAAGEPVTLAEWLPKPPPEDQNFAFNPVFVRRFGIGHPAPFTILRWDWPPGTLTGHEPPDGFPIEALGGFDGNSPAQFSQLAAALPPPFATDPGATEELAAEAIVRWSGQWDEEFATLAKAARERPYGSVPTDETPQGWNRRIERFEGWLAGARLLQLRALAQTRIGDASGALDSITIGLRMANTAATEPCDLIGFVVGSGTTALQFVVIHHGLQRQLWTAKQLQDIESQLAGIDPVSDFRRAIRAERLRPNALIDAQLDAASKTFVYWGQPTDPWPVRLAPRGALRQNQVRIVDWQLTQHSRLQKEFFERLPRTPPGPTTHTPYSWLFNIVVAGTKGLEETTDELAGTLRLARLAIALDRQLLVEGRYPNSLADLHDPAQRELTRDPFTGGTVHFTLVDGRPKLWLAGRNQRDDGGLNEAMGGDDIVWGPAAR